MPDHHASFVFPRISDHAVVALNDFIETFYTDFQNHYYAQIKRYYDDRENDRATGDHRQIPLPLDDPEQTHF